MTLEDDLRQAVGERQGTAIRFTDIDGIGQKTAQRIKQSGRIRSPSDISDKTAEELAEQAGISESRARIAIEGAGGDPDRKPRSTTGSVSAAGIKMPQGEFVTEVSDQDKAEAKFSTSLNRGIGRSQEAAAADKGKRAPVTTDYERWKKNKGELDFPGVDTPTDEPNVLPKDLRQKQRPATTDPPDPPTPQRDDTGSATGALSSTFGVSPEEPRDSMVADGMGGVRYNANVGGYRETDRTDEEIDPPQPAIENQDNILSIQRNERAAEQAGVLDGGTEGPQRADRKTLSNASDEALNAGVAVAGFGSDQFDATDTETPDPFALGGTTQAPLSAATVTDDDPANALGDSTVDTLRETVDYLETEYGGDPQEELDGFGEFATAVRTEAQVRGDER